jgi:glycosyltransferase involved in cell wall biosynthesis
VAKLRGARFVNWLQDLYPETAERLGVRILSGPLGGLAKRLRDASLRSADATVAIGEVMARFVRERAGANARVEVIQNWLDETATRPVAAADNALRQAWNPEGRFVVAYSGNLGRAHEYDTLLQAAESLRDEARVLFLFIGGGHRTRSLMAEVEKRGLGHLFRFEPYQPAERLSESLSVGDVHWISLVPQMEGLIVPSKFFGVAAVGRPTIAVVAPDGELARIVTEGGCGVVVSPGDGEGLAQAILSLMRDDEGRAAMGERARRLAEGPYARSAALDRWERTLLGVTGSESAR